MTAEAHRLAEWHAKKRKPAEGVGEAANMLRKRKRKPQSCQVRSTRKRTQTEPTKPRVRAPVDVSDLRSDASGGGSSDNDIESDIEEIDQDAHENVVPSDAVLEVWEASHEADEESHLPVVTRTCE